MSIILNRKSSRTYLDTKVTDKQIESILKAAMQAPSAHNQQPWEFIVVNDRKILNALVAAAPNARALLTAPIAIIPILRPTTLSPLFSIQDMSAATQNILLEAENLGLGTVWIGVLPNEERVAAVKKILNIKDSLNPFSIIALGVSNDPRKSTSRYDESRIHYNVME
ncbi:MAG: nitroreductase family protein [Candidatus Izemoplasma sp.]